MIDAEIRRFIKLAPTAIVASTDSSGQSHLAAGKVSTEEGSDLLVFENWLCYRTLDNVRENPRVAVMVIDQEAKIGYQFRGRVVDTLEVAMMDGYQPEAKPVGQAQALTRLVVRVEKSVAFCEGLHVDREESFSPQTAVTAGRQVH